MSWAKASALSCLAVLAPIKAVIVTVGVLIFADLVTGIVAARRRGERITSAAIRRTVGKMLVYQCSVLAGFLAEKYMLTDLVPVSKIIAGAIGLVELKSIIENSEAALGKPIFATLIRGLGSKNDK